MTSAVISAQMNGEKKPLQFFPDLQLDLPSSALKTDFAHKKCHKDRFGSEKDREVEKYSCFWCIFAWLLPERCSFTKCASVKEHSCSILMFTASDHSLATWTWLRNTYKSTQWIQIHWILKIRVDSVHILFFHLSTFLLLVCFCWQSLTYFN